MQTKLKPIFLLATLAATAILLYAANEARAQGPAIGLFDVSSFSPTLISISPKLGNPDKVLDLDSTMVMKKLGVKHLPTK